MLFLEAGTLELLSEFKIKIRYVSEFLHRNSVTIDFFQQKMLSE